MVQKLIDPEDLRLAPAALERPEEAFAALLSWADALSVRAGVVLGLRLEVHAERGEPDALAEVALLRDRRERHRIARRGLVDRRANFAPLTSCHPAVRARATAEGLELSFEVPEGATLDRDNLRARVADPGALLELVSHVESLPEDVTVGGRPARTLSVDEVRELVEAPDAAFVAVVPPGRVADQDGHAEEIALALLHLYKIVAWADDNDGVRPSAKRRSKGKERDVARTKRPRRVKEDRDDEPIASAASPASGRGAADREVESAAAAPSPPMLRTLRLAHRARVVDIDPTRPIEKGTSVVALTGPFEGKTGVVRELDGKGGARVMFGLLVATADLKDLAACAAKPSRRLLSSSHRTIVARKRP